MCACAFSVKMVRSKYALVFSDVCSHNENVLEYVRKQLQKFHLNCETSSLKDSKPGHSILITATFDSLLKEVFKKQVYIHCIILEYIKS